MICKATGIPVWEIEGEEITTWSWKESVILKLEAVLRVTLCWEHLSLQSLETGKGKIKPRACLPLAAGSEHSGPEESAGELRPTLC